MDKIKYKDIFRKLINMKHGMVIDFNSIEQKLKYLREGGSLTYDDLEVIADDNCWPFNKYWMWPCRGQIDDKLNKTNNCFMHLPDNEEKVIGQLLDIFKNISLVSIILRFVCPKFYAIYSRPPLYLLRIERGINDIDEYINYVNELRILKESFKEERTAETDMIVWAIAEETQKENKSFNEKKTLEEFIKLLAEKLPENLTIGELVNHHSQEPLKIAEKRPECGQVELLKNISLRNAIVRGFICPRLKEINYLLWLRSFANMTDFGIERIPYTD